jgi:hypothetical protein
MVKQFIAIIAAVAFAGAALVMTRAADAQNTLRQLAVKNGETIDLGSVYYVSNCRSIMIGLPEIEVLEGPSGVTLGIREEPVLPRRQSCAAKVAGGTLTLTAKDVTEQAEAKLTYRVKYQTKDGPRETSNSFLVSLFP